MNRSIDYSKHEYLPDKKSIPIVMKICFSEEKLRKKFGTPLSTNPTISEQFFHDSSLCPNSKKREPRG